MISIDSMVLIFISPDRWQYYKTYVAEKYVDDSVVFPLCRSYRFGQDIADAGNVFLDAMGAQYRLIGLGPKDMTVGNGETNTILFCSNLKMIMEILAGHKQDPTRKFHVVGGTTEMVSVLNDLSSLYSGKIALSSELCGFVDWNELRSFSETPLGSVLTVSNHC